MGSGAVGRERDVGRERKGQKEDRVTQRMGERKSKGEGGGMEEEGGGMKG